MLLSTHATVRWNARNKKHYTDLGYYFTKMKDEFEVSVDDLTPGSVAIVHVKCDYCGSEYPIEWQTYLAMKKRTLQNDCCKDCCEIKAREAVEKKYGGMTEMYFSCDEKRRQTNINRYGSENVFASDAIKEKIVTTNLLRYGVEYTQQCPEIRNKTIASCREKYGVDHYVELFKGKFIKENSPVWKGGVEYSRIERASHEYIQWRKGVFERDGYHCQCCGAHNGDGRYVELHAHHILNWKDNPENRYDISNGVTLCVACHNAFHSVYGKHNNTYEQLIEFIDLSGEKIC